MGVLILVDFQADHIAVNDLPLKRFKAYNEFDFIVASRRYTAKTPKGTKGARINSYVSKHAHEVVTREGVAPSVFEGGTLRPIESTEHILKSIQATDITVGGYFLEWTVAQTAFDANALGYNTKVDLSLTSSEKGTDLAQNVADLSFDEVDILGRLEKAGVQIIVSQPATLVET